MSKNKSGGYVPMILALGFAFYLYSSMLVYFDWQNSTAIRCLAHGDATATIEILNYQPDLWTALTPGWTKGRWVAERWPCAAHPDHKEIP